MSAILEVVADHQIGMAIAIQIGKHRRIGEPALVAGDQLYCLVAFGLQHRGVAGSACGAQKSHRSASPVINNNVRQPIFIEVADQAAHGGHGGRIIARRPQRKWLVAFAGCRGRLNGDLIGTRIDEASVIGEAIAIQIAGGDGSAYRGDPGGNAFQAGMHRAHFPRIHIAAGRQRVAGEMEARSQFHARTRGDSRHAGLEEEKDYDDGRNNPRDVSA